MTTRLEPPAGIEAGGDLWAFMDQVAGVLAEVKPALVAILLPEDTGGDREERFTPRQTHRSLAPRIAMETVIRLASAREGVPCDLLSRQTVRARLKLKGKFKDAVNGWTPRPSVKYWTVGTGLAALAAKAGEL